MVDWNNEICLPETQLSINRKQMNAEPLYNNYSLKISTLSKG